MRYLFKVTIMPTKSEAYFRVQDMLAIQRDHENLLETIVVILTPTGPKPFKVLETCTELAATIEAAVRPDPKPGEGKGVGTCLELEQKKV